MTKKIYCVILTIVSVAILCGCNGKISDKKSLEAAATVVEEEKSQDIAEEAQEDETDSVAISLEDIKNANSYESLLKSHTIVSYDSSQYANRDLENGYLGFDKTTIKISGEDISYLSSAASQSVPFTVVIEKNSDGIYAEKSQFAGESIVETAFESEEEMRKALKRLWIFDNEDFMKEKITDVATKEGFLVVVTVRTPDAGEYADDIVERTYYLNPDSLELQEMNEIFPTNSDYGDVETVTHVIYDREPDFAIEFTPEPEDVVTDEDYDNMGNAEDGEV